ncbi:MAG: hypothetical protein KBS81_11205 [Spirochaetales bacterium]|nr:hypothetical protein [Candidatus Physcosoma equi]
MSAVPILIIIFGFIAFLSWVGETEKTKRTKMKIEASLRSEEMARGYAPGTFSDLSDQDEKDAKANQTSKMTRAEMEKAMADLEERLKNLDSIMNERNKG